MFDTYTSGVYVYGEKVPNRTDRLTFIANSESYTMKRTVSEQRYSIGGLTRAAAEAGATALASSTVTAIARPSGNGPMWSLDVISVTVGAWSTET